MAINKQSMIERTSGCILGGAVGDALGMPVIGLTPYQILLKFGAIDGFFPGDVHQAGAYTGVTQVALATAFCIVRNGGVTPETIAQSRTEVMRKNPPDMKWPQSILSGMGDSMDAAAMPSVAPLGLLAAARGWPEAELAKAVKAVVGLSHKRKTAQLCGFVVARMIQRLVMEPSLSDPATLYEADDSLLSSIIGYCERVEASFDPDEAGDDRVSRRLLYVRRQLQRKAKLAEVAGAHGNDDKCLEVVPFSIFCFLHKCPENFDCASLAASMGRASSTNAAIVGSMVGAYTGIQAVTPSSLIDKVSNAGGLISISGRLAEACMPVATV